MSPSHKPLMISQPRRTRLAGLTLHVCRFRAEESAHAASRRERPQNAPRHRGRPTPWAQGRDGFVLTIFHKLNPSNSCPVSGALLALLCSRGCRFLRCYGYRRVFIHDHPPDLGGPARGAVRPGRYASGAGYILINSWPSPGSRPTLCCNNWWPFAGSTVRMRLSPVI